MAGIYIHIPFCKQKCSYCDFHFSTNLTNRQTVVNTICNEIELKKTVLPNNEKIATIYVGGGTPSLLFEEELAQILEAIYKNYRLEEKIEFTLECNPDDINIGKLKILKNNGVNRLSIGVQSFFDEDLKFFNRAHNQQQAEKSILLSQDAGINNITIDLIYNSPQLTLKKWEQNLDKFIQLNIPHLSAYTLTVEPKTALYHLVKTKQTVIPSDEQAIEQFNLLIEKVKQVGLIHYEISNFGKEGFFSQHNSNYWKGENYLGFGPSAHSFIKNNTSQKRSWNIANNTKYTKAIQQNLPFFEEEIIDETTAYNEYILTRLRTIWGVDMGFIKKTFSSEISNHFFAALATYKNTHLITISENKLTLAQEGIFLTDKITSDLFFV